MWNLWLWRSRCFRNWSCDIHEFVVYYRPFVWKKSERYIIDYLINFRKNNRRHTVDMDLGITTKRRRTIIYFVKLVYVFFFINEERLLKIRVLRWTFWDTTFQSAEYLEIYFIRGEREMSLDTSESCSSRPEKSKTFSGVDRRKHLNTNWRRLRVSSSYNFNLLYDNNNCSKGETASRAHRIKNIVALRWKINWITKSHLRKMWIVNNMCTIKNTESRFRQNCTRQANFNCSTHLYRVFRRCIIECRKKFPVDA